MRLATVFVIFSAMIFVAASASAATWIIKPDGSGDAPTIQAGIDSAANGDVVELTDGVFTGDGNRDIDFQGKAITVRSVSGNPDACRIDLMMDPNWVPRRGFYFHHGEGSNSILSGVSIHNGYIPQSESNNRGGGIECDGASPTIENCEIVGCQAQYGGGIDVQNDSVATITDCDLVDNWSFMHGGGICCTNTGTVNIQDCTISNNSASGFYINSASAVLNNCEILENSGAWMGGGGWIDHGDSLVLIDCVIRGNASIDGGGVYFYYTPVSRIENSVITGNRAGSTGGGIVCSMNSHLLIKGSTISGNSCGHQAGGIVCDASMQLERTIVYGNCSGSFATPYEIWNNGGNISLECCATDSSEVGGGGTTTWIGTNVFTDPLFCDPAGCESPPTVDGDYSLHSDSPCLYHPDCGQIGAFGEGCSGPSATTHTSWGEVKRLFR